MRGIKKVATGQEFCPLFCDNQKSNHSKETAGVLNASNRFRKTLNGSANRS